MSLDIGSILNGWEHDPDDLQVRIITGEDGKEKLQQRLDLGLLQMELEGRPDGLQPFDTTSYLDHYEAEAESARLQGQSYELQQEACAHLMREGIQYYHRYVALFHLGRYDLVARDTDRNLRLFQFVRTHAQETRDQLAFDQYRPYVTMMRARALAHQAIDRSEHREALHHIDEGIRLIKKFFEDYEQEDQANQCQEISLLRQWRKEVEQERKLDPLERLEEQLDHAVAREDYEEAARIRDQLQRLRGHQTPSAQGR